MAMSHEAAASKTQFECVTPILKVESLAASLDYYIGQLGFTVDWQHQGIMASVGRDKAHIMLCQGDQGNAATWVWIGVSDAEELFREYQSKRARIALPPTNYPCACEIQVQDPDGHILRFGSESHPDRPLAEWVQWYSER
jgi:hypothetical protein